MSGAVEDLKFYNMPIGDVKYEAIRYDYDCMVVLSADAKLLKEYEGHPKGERVRVLLGRFFIDDLPAIITELEAIK